MKQYLLTVNQPDGPPPPSVDMGKVMRDVNSVIREMKTARAWVFNAALHPPTKHGHGRAAPRRRLTHDRRTLRRGQGTHWRNLHHQGARPGCRARVEPQARPRDHPPDRGATLPGGGSGLIPGGTALAAPEIERVFREGYGRALAVLVRVFGDIDIAEEAVQDAFTAAVQRWPSTGLPPRPAGWIITTAKNRAIDRLRREASRRS